MKRKQEKNEVMKKTMIWFISALLIVGSASAELITVTDSLANTYGNTQGIAVDFDTTVPTIGTGWAPALTDGQQYSVDSISVISGAEVLAGTGTVYLGVYTSIAGDISTGFLGASTNTIDFTATADGDWATFNFSGINVTADSVAGSGTGLLYFVFQQTTDAKTGTGGDEIRIHRINTDTTIDQSLSNVMAYGGLSSLRSPEYQAQVTVVPEPTTLALLGLGALSMFRKRK